MTESSVTVEEILAALPDGDLVVNIRNRRRIPIATNTPILRPEAGEPDEESGLPTVKIVFDDGSSMGASWPVADISRHENGVVELVGPGGVAAIAKR